MCLRCCHLTRLFFNKTPPCHTYGKRHLRTDSQSFKLFLCITKPKSFHYMHSETLATLDKLAISRELHNSTEVWKENILPMSESCHIHQSQSRAYATVRNSMLAGVWEDGQETVGVGACGDETVSHRTAQTLKYSLTINTQYWVVHECVCVQSVSILER